jgi:hypothetical protein
VLDIIEDDWRPVERCDTPVLLVERICTDLFEVGMHRIEKALRPVERQEGGVGDLEELLVAPGAEAGSTR